MVLPLSPTGVGVNRVPLAATRRTPGQMLATQQELLVPYCACCAARLRPKCPDISSPSFHEVAPPALTLHAICHATLLMLCHAQLPTLRFPRCAARAAQGLEDQIVPPNQAELMFAELKKRGIPTALVLFEGEQHGFRQSTNIRLAGWVAGSVGLSLASAV